MRTERAGMQDILDGNLADISKERNGDNRKYTTPLNPVVRFLYRVSGGRLKANHISVATFLAGAAAVVIEEGQNITGKRTLKKTAIALTLEGASGLGDLLDGKYARYERSFMPEGEEKDEHEKKGTGFDPLLDGLLEAFRKMMSIRTAIIRGDIKSANAAVDALERTNLPRTAKAAVGAIGVVVPESYHLPDLRFFGTSSGRRGPDLLASLFHNLRGFPVQRCLDQTTGNADGVVAAERLLTALNPDAYKLDKKEIGRARYKLKVLGIESLVFAGLAYAIRKLFLTGRTEKGSPTT